MNTPRTAVYLFSASIFLFGSGYACPPDHVEPNSGESDGGDGKKADNAWDEFLDRTGKCIELEGKDCDGYPGRGKTGRAKGERFPNFIAGTCDKDGDTFEFAEMFKLNKDGTPKYKSIVLIAGHDG